MQNSSESLMGKYASLSLRFRYSQFLKLRPHYDHIMHINNLGKAVLELCLKQFIFMSYTIFIVFTIVINSIYISIVFIIVNTKFILSILFHFIQIKKTKYSLSFFELFSSILKTTSSILFDSPFLFSVHNCFNNFQTYYLCFQSCKLSFTYLPRCDLYFLKIPNLIHFILEKLNFVLFSVTLSFRPQKIKIENYIIFT